MHFIHQISQRRIAKNLKKTHYWVRKVLQKQKRNQWALLKGSKRPARFDKIHQRARLIIDKFIKDCRGPILLPDIQNCLQKEHRIKVGTTLLR
jgi:hypothetical protein